jgi:ABC-type transport system involved in cytochrome c biogenesis permease subunit
VVFKKRPEQTVLLLLTVGLLLHTAAIGLRWERLGHGPFITMYEILSSNLWSLSLIFTLAYWRFTPVRPIAAIVMPILFMMMGWLMITNPGEGSVPPTYDTIWLYIHILLGKVFLGSVLVALGLSGVVLTRTLAGESCFQRMPGNSSLVELAYRFMAVALIFDSLMLVSGAIWAQDAWGRYWNWDPLETWAFLTWLSLALAIHTRATFKPSPVTASVMVLLVFVLGFLTFFGVPFLSQAPHKGMV